MLFKNKTLITAFLALLLSFGLYTFARAEVKTLGNAGAFYTNLQVSNGQVIWQESEPCPGVPGMTQYNNSLWLYNGGPQPVLLAASTSYMSPGGFSASLDHGEVVWSAVTPVYDNNGQVINSVSEIFASINGNPTRLTNNLLYDPTNALTVYHNSSPCVSNGQVVWQGSAAVYDNSSSMPMITGSDRAVFLYNNAGMPPSKVAEAFNSATSSGQQPVYLLSPQINNGLILWQKYTSVNMPAGSQYILCSNRDYDHQPNATGYYVYSPSMSNGQAVWQSYDGANYQIYLYDGSQTTPITSGTANSYDPQISNGKVVWESNGQIYLYDIASKAKTIIASTDNNTPSPILASRISNNQVVWVDMSGKLSLYDITAKTTKPVDTGDIMVSNNLVFDNGQVVWVSSDSSGTPKVFLTDLQSLEMLDGSDFSAGTTIFTNPNKLVDNTAPQMNGAVTDGVSRLLLRLQTSDAHDVTFKIETGDSGNPAVDNGWLETLNGQNSTSGSQDVTVTPTQVNGQYYAFAVYRAPKHFVHKDSDKNISERTVTLDVTSGVNPITTKDITLDRPPLLLVHGLWANKDMWYENPCNFYVGLLNTFPRLLISTPDYQDSNSSSLSVNKDIMKDNIVEAKKVYRLRNIADAQVDIVAHSMGGLLARIWAEAGKKVYARDNNFEAGDIDKLITLDTPHRGSFLADAGFACYNGPHSPAASAIFTAMESSGKYLTKGAVEDLKTTSPAIVDINSKHTNVPAHAIVGNYINYSVKSRINPYGETIYTINGLPGSYLNIPNILEENRYLYGRPDYEMVSYIMNGSDLVVSTDSQQGGLGSATYSVNHHDHTNATTSEVLSRIIELLNGSKDDNVFSKVL